MNRLQVIFIPNRQVRNRNKCESLNSTEIIKNYSKKNKPSKRMTKYGTKQHFMHISGFRKKTISVIQDSEYIAKNCY